MNTLAVYITVALCAVAFVQATEFRQCTDGPPPKELRIQGCQGFPCRIYRGHDLSAQWDWVANGDAEQLKTRVMVTVFGNKTPYPYPQPDACKSLAKGECPLEKGDELTYELRMPISINYPPISLSIEFALVDENANVQVCFEIDAQVVTPDDVINMISKENDYDFFDEDF